MPKACEKDVMLNPRWLAFWRKVKAAAELDAAQNTDIEKTPGAGTPDV